jgi:hypothetical protein
MDMGMDSQAASDTRAYVDQLKGRIDQIKTKDEAVKQFAKEEKAEAKKLELFMV